MHRVNEHQWPTHGLCTCALELRPPSSPTIRIQLYACACVSDDPPEAIVPPQYARPLAVVGIAQLQRSTQRQAS